MKTIIIGGVAGGMSTAAKLKRNLKDAVDITVYEKGAHVSYGACGIPFFVAGAVESVSNLVERTPDQFAATGIDLNLRHQVIGVDTANRTVEVRNLDAGASFHAAYDKLVVASGAKPRNIPPLDTPRDNLFVVRGLDDATAIKRRLQQTGVKNVTIVGAGFIGLEMVEACAKHGKTVTLVEFADRVLPVMDPEFSARLETELETNKIAVRTSSKITGLAAPDNRIVSVTVETDGAGETLPTDMVINCAGIAPETDFINVEKAPNGAILVNERMETSAPDVYAAGDCSIMRSFVTGEPQYAPLGTNANKQGRIIAELLAGKPAPTLKLIGASALRLFALDAAKVGLSENDARSRNLNVKTNLITGNSYASYYNSGSVMVKLVYDADTRLILGAQLLGVGVVAARANYFAIAISAGMRVDDFGFLDLCYSPPFSGVWDPTLIVANTAK